MNIRLETKDDYRQVEELTRDAFWNLYAPGCDEHYLCHILREHTRGGHYCLLPTVRSHRIRLFRSYTLLNCVLGAHKKNGSETKVFLIRHIKLTFYSVFYILFLLKGFFHIPINPYRLPFRRIELYIACRNIHYIGFCIFITIKNSFEKFIHKFTMRLLGSHAMRI